MNSFVETQYIFCGKTKFGHWAKATEEKGKEAVNITNINMKE